jgi:hypothetical protein
LRRQFRGMLGCHVYFRERAVCRRSGCVFAVCFIFIYSVWSLQLLAAVVPEVWFLLVEVFIIP